MVLLYFAFVGFVLVSFLWFGRGWLADPRRWHIGSMSISYVFLVFLVAMLSQEFQQRYYHLVFLVAMVFGIAGLGVYWIRDRRILDARISEGTTDDE